MNRISEIDSPCQHYLFVCTANTCRSPMGAVMMRNEVAGRLGVQVKDLERNGYVIKSAGPWAYQGMGISEEAQIVLAELGYPVPNRGARELSSDLALEAAQIFAMTRWHMQQVLQKVPQARNRIRLLNPDGRDIVDPIGMDLDTYRDVGRIIQKSVQGIVADLFKDKK